jgi:thymidylate synthase
MHILKSENLSDLLKSLITHIIDIGYPVTIRGIQTIESEPVIVELNSAINRSLSVNTINLNLILTKCLQIVANDHDNDTINFFERESILKPSAGFLFNDFSQHFFLTDLRQVYQRLKNDKSSRQAIIRWPANGSNPSITSSLQFVVREDKLTLISSFRSNEIWKGFPTDAFFLMFFQELLASWLNIGMGKLIHFVACPHIYKENVKEAAMFLKSENRGSEYIPRIQNLDISNSQIQAKAILSKVKSLKNGNGKISLLALLLAMDHTTFFSLKDSSITSQL